VEYKFTDVSVISLCKTILSLNETSNYFTVKFSKCLEDLEAVDLCRLIETCGVKTDLIMDIPEKMFSKIMERSPHYEDYFNVQYTSSTITGLTKLFRACVTNQ
jgi:hypothetical protein